MAHQSIPQEAVEVAYAAWFAHKSRLTPGDTKVAMREALEAAAPHMLAVAWDNGYSEGWDNDGDLHANPYRQP